MLRIYNVVREQDGASGFSLFEALREAIYAEVATLISQNETRPHFLIELFRNLQMLSTDFLRQRALIAINDLIKHYLTDAKIDVSTSVSNVSYFANHCLLRSLVNDDCFEFINMYYYLCFSLF